MMSISKNMRMVRTIVPEKPDVRTVRKNGVYTQLLVLALVYMIVQNYAGAFL